MCVKIILLKSYNIVVLNFLFLVYRNIDNKGNDVIRFDFVYVLYILIFSENWLVINVNLFKNFSKINIFVDSFEIVYERVLGYFWSFWGI